uniref:RNA helicase n=1 Tax=Nothobranchius furzeri TaxID=105023 RepID=A0A8C6KJC6_NOTFU
MFNAPRATMKPSKNKKSSHHGSNSSESKEIHIDEGVKIAVNLSLERFCYSDQKELEFPSSFTSTERAFVHRLAQSFGYISKSKGKGASRFLTVRKKGVSAKSVRSIFLTLSPSSSYFIRSLLQRFPGSKRERSVSYLNRASGRLNNGIPMVPQKRTPSDLDSFRCSLPVYEQQERIVQLIRENRVVLIVGETGSGKTTQISQYLLDDSSRKGQPCRIFCTQPRRLAAIAVAERVAAERGESVGQTVGYHIRLESRVSPKTQLTFCTSGVLLRTLMAGDTSLTTVTHVIVDEVHERDGLTDFLLTKLRDVLQKIPTLKLILSSAALDTDLFLQYFGFCPVIQRRQFDVKELFLEDILRLTGFNRKDVSKYAEETQRQEKKQKCLTEWCEAVELCAEDKRNNQMSAPSFLHDGDFEDEEDSSVYKLVIQTLVLPEPWLVKEMDSCISNIFLHNDQEAFSQLLNLILNECIPVDYMHSETGSTALMVAAGRGFTSQIQQLLSLGADINLKAANGWTALDFAKHFQQTEAMDFLRSSIPLVEGSELEDDALMQHGAPELNAEEQELLRVYHHSFDDQRVDLDLIMTLLHNICSTTSDGAVLIFLPGYDEIVSLRDRIMFADKGFFTNPDSYQVLTLHSDMQTLDQKKAMKPSPPGIRKIILSTNIAETSITINDVVFVINSGKVKEKSFDTLSRVSMLKTVWVSKASVLQRKGRAGRCQPGVCFHLFSRLRFNNMQEFQVPQLLRMPLQELCLQTKLLAPSCPVHEFLSRAPQPPPSHAIKSAVQMLKTIDALDQNEDLTDLGYHLADLPVEPHLGKMVLCAVMLKCLDPILTIACTLAYRDPFVLPTDGSQKRAALESRRRFTSNSFSDHMALLRVFQAWQKARSDGWERSFCQKNFLSQATMDMILGMRTQLLGQLRAIGFVRARGGSDIRDVNLNSENWAMVKAALVAGMYPNLVHINKETSVFSSNREKKVHFHPTSILSQLQVKESAKTLPTDWLIYDEMSRGHRMASVRCCTLVTSITIAIFAGSTQPSCSGLQEPTVHKTNGEKDFISDSRREIDLNAGLVSELRHKWQSLFLKRIRSPSKPWSQQDEAIIQTLVSVLGAQEQEAGLQQPAGIGQRPRPMSSEDGPQTSVGTSKSRLQPATSTTNERFTLPQTVLPSVRYFVMKSSNARNIDISQEKGIWSTTPSNETKLTKAFMGHNLIILIFSVQGSGHFQGYAHMTSAASQESCQDWGFVGLGGGFSVEWVHKESLPFHLTQHILNPWNDNKKVQISRDGQELEPQTGSQLVLLWDQNFRKQLH